MAELIRIPSPGASLVYGTEGGPLVVLVHDRYGRLPWLEPLADAVSRHGYRVLVPDLYDGWATIDDTDADELVTMLDRELAIAVLDAAVATERAAGSQRVALIGFGAGGALALEAAQAGHVDALVAYDATLPPELHGVVPCPTLLHLGGAQDWPAGEDPESFVGRLKEHGTPIMSHVYEGAANGFANATIRERLDGASASLAYARSMSFLNGHLIDY